MGSGLSSKKKPPPVIASCKAPIYSVKRMGPRHLFVAGGGGAAKTGVLNNMEALLLMFDSKGTFPVTANLTTQFSTGSFATMNLDLIPYGPPQAGVYRIAAGHDQYCDIYETIGFNVDANATASKNLNLGFKIREVARLTTDERVENAYQKCVRFDRSRGGQRLATGGSDGHIRIWDIKALDSNRDPRIRHEPIVDISAHLSDVDDIDLSQDGSIVASVGDGKAFLWDTHTGRKIFEVPLPNDFQGKYRVRSLRFVPHDGNRYVFVVAYNQIQRTSKSNCYLGLWVFSKERNQEKIIMLREIAKQAISSLTVSSCGDYTGVGTLGGSVGIFDTHDLKPLLWNFDTHGIFVTGLEFIERQANDIVADDNGKLQKYPGPAASWKVALVSLSADQTVQLHTVPIPTATSLADTLFWVSLWTFFIQMLFLFIKAYL
ncbi:unnamed protein product, partial [Mesorhabditis belari]|uniref:Prolactin regulatory element-binding protein n=1 Tax=Mesorhabditis belari TaxID=2138241 RepID=A0AAF3J668_9BILA